MLTSLPLCGEVFSGSSQILQGGALIVAKVELKQPIVQAIADDIKDAQSVVLVDYRGLTVAQDTELRKQLREAGVIYKVCKNTMMKRAFEGTEFAGLEEYLEGPSALVVSKDDATAPARIICKFAKTAEALEVKAGVVEGNVYDAAGINELSKVHLSQILLVYLIRSLNRAEQEHVKQRLRKLRQKNRLRHRLSN